MTFFERLSLFICKRLYLPVVLWPLLAIVLVVSLPSMREAADESQLSQLGETADHFLANKMIEEGFPGQTYYSSAAILFERRTGIEGRDRKFVSEIAAYLRSGQGPEGIHSILSSRDPFLGEKLRSADGQSESIIVRLTTGFVAEATKGTLKTIRKKLETAPRGLNTYVTGESAVGADYGNAAGKSLHRTTTVTLILVIIILLVIYRSPITPLVPLVTVAISFFISRSIAIMLALAGFPVPEMVQTFLIVILFGAGTDYCLFLASRYREELAKTHDYTQAIRRMMKTVGAAISASALTTVVGLGSMGFANFGVFAAAGPCLAIGIIVTLAVSLTFAPALLRILGPLAYWPAHADIKRSGSKIWQRIADMVVGAPVRTVLVVVGVLIPLAIVGTRMKPSYDIISELPSSSPSVVGYYAFSRHYSESDLMPVTLVFRADAGDLRSPEGIETVNKLTAHLMKHPGVTGVMSITRPLGDPLNAGEIASIKMFSSSSVSPGASGSDAARPSMKLFGGILKLPGLGPSLNKKIKLLNRALAYYISENGSLARMNITLKANPYSQEAIDTIESLRTRIADASDIGPVKIGEFHFTGATARINDVRHLTSTDLTRIRVLVVIGVLAVLVIEFRWIFTAIYLVATMILSYYATLGVSLLFFTKIMGEPGLDWKVEYFMFVLLIALGIDYNILIMSRIKEERKLGDPRNAIRRACIVTGAIITSCGVIMAGTFSSLMASPLAVMMQLGFAVAFGVLLDTFVVRLMLVPAIAALTDRFAAKFKKQAHGA